MNKSVSTKQWVVRQLVYADALSELDKVFSALGIEYIPLKGAHLICTGLAEKMSTRIMNDIDILVRPADFDKTIQLLANIPDFTKKDPDPWSFEQSFAFHIKGIDIPLEIHKALNRPERFHLPAEDLFRRATSHTLVRKIMSPEDALAVLICHTLVHLVDGIKEQVFEEIGVLSAASRFTWEQFRSILKTTGIRRFGYALLWKWNVTQKAKIPVTLQSRFWSNVLFSTKPPGYFNGLKSYFYRGTIELLFVKQPLAMAVGYLRHWK